MVQPASRRLVTETALAAVRTLPYTDIFSGDDLNTKRTPGRYRANSSTHAGGITNSPTSQAYVCDVEAGTSGLVSQIVTELYGPNNNVYKRTTSSISTTPFPFGPWESLKSNTGRTAITSGTDIDTLRTPGARYIVNSNTIGQTLLNAPSIQPATLDVEGTTGGLISHTWKELYSSGGGTTFVRTTASIGTTPYPFGVWKDLGAVPPAPTSTDAGLANAVLMQDFTRRHGGRIKTGGKGACAFRFDHGLNNYANMLLPLMQSRNFKHSQVLSSAGWGLAENNTVTPADVDALVASGILEIWHHGGNNHADANTPEKLTQYIVDGLASLRADLPTAKIDGWAVPGVTGTLYMGFNGGITPDKFYATEAGRLILANHAVSTGGIANTYQRVLDGTVRQGQHQYTLDERTVAQATAEIDLAIANGTGLQFMLHPSVVGSVDRMTLAQFTEVLDYVKTKETAGDLLVLSPYELMVADKF